MNKEELTKKYNTWIKGSVGTVGLALIVNMIYLFGAFIKKKPEFPFSLGISDLALKLSGLFEGHEKTIPLWAGIIIAVVPFALGVFFTLKANKNPKHLVECLIFFILDTLLLVYVMAANPVGDAGDITWINIITHGFVLVFAVVGLIAVKRKQKI